MEPLSAAGYSGTPLARKLGILVAAMAACAAACADRVADTRDEASRWRLADTLWLGALDGDGPGAAAGRASSST